MWLSGSEVLVWWLCTPCPELPSVVISTPSSVMLAPLSARTPLALLLPSISEFSTVKVAPFEPCTTPFTPLELSREYSPLYGLSWHALLSRQGKLLISAFATP